MASMRLVSSILFVVLTLAGMGPRVARGVGDEPAPAPPQLVGPPPDHGGHTFALTIAVADSTGRPLAARAQVLASDGHPRPSGPDPLLMSHSSIGGYFYLDGETTLAVPDGQTRVVVSRGPEISPVTLDLDVESDTSVTVTLERFTDLRPRGWFGGDLHAHTRHGRLDYEPTPEQVRLVAEAEGLAVLHLLDNGWQFTGGPHALSDSDAVLYYSYEHRNQTFGHVGLPGLRSPVSDECCLYPDEPPYPMILDLSAAVHAQNGGLAVLAHPHTTDDYDLLEDWPGAGLGRELPVLAALGGLDALEVASYSNDPDLDTAEWFDLLSAGFAAPPSAGTDAVLNWYSQPPPGGWRVYARQSGGGAFDYDAWLAGLAAGHTFITSAPLVPEFTVGGSAMGDTLEVAGDSLVAPVHIEASCAAGLRSVTLVADGRQVWTQDLLHGPVAYDYDTTFVLSLPRPGWVLLRVDGASGFPALAVSQPIAYTSAVRIRHEGAPARLPDAMGRLLGEVDRLRDLLVTRCDWPVAWQEDTVLARIARAREFYARPFRSPPTAFALLSPPPGDSATADLRWQAAVDPDPGDVVTYTVRVGEDSTLAGGWTVESADTDLVELPLTPGRWYWWSVTARDRAGDSVASSPALARFFLASSAGVPPGRRELRAQALPNPSRGAVALRGMGVDVAIYDMAGRRVAEAGRGVTWSAGTPVWDGDEDGHAAPPGIYLARGGDQKRLVRIVRLR